MFTVTHYGLSKKFTSIYAAMRHLKSLGRSNVKANLWAVDRPLTDTDRFIKPSKYQW